MATVTMEAELARPLKTVWDLVTDLGRWDWRSDLARIEVTGEGAFVEYTKDGFATSFAITCLEPMTRYAFEMENDNMRGAWTGTFRETAAGCAIVFTEDVTAKKALLRPFVGGYLKKQQRQYLGDMKRALGL